MQRFSIAIHGGAGTILPHLLTTEKEKAYRDGLHDAINAGKKILQFHLLSFHYINQLFFPQFLAYRQPSKHIFLLKVLV